MGRVLAKLLGILIEGSKHVFIDDGITTLTAECQVDHLDYSIAKGGMYMNVGILDITLQMPSTMLQSVSYFLHDCRQSIQTNIVIRCKYCNELPIWSPNPNYVHCQLKNIDYYYSVSDGIYYAHNEFLHGEINPRQECVTWWVLDSKINYRALFHLCILD